MLCSQAYGSVFTVMSAGATCPMRPRASVLIMAVCLKMSFHGESIAAKRGGLMRACSVSRCFILRSIVATLLYCLPCSSVVFSISISTVRINITTEFFSITTENSFITTERFCSLAVQTQLSHHTLLEPPLSHTASLNMSNYAVPIQAKTASALPLPQSSKHGQCSTKAVSCTENMRGWWKCHMCHHMNNPNLTPEKCGNAGKCEHLKCPHCKVSKA